MKIRFTVDVDNLPPNPAHIGILYRDVDWPAHPMTGEYVDVADDWGDLTVTRVFWGRDGLVMVELGKLDPASAEELHRDEPSWKFSKSVEPWPAFSATTDRRSEFVVLVQTYALSYDMNTGKAIAGAVVGEAMRIGLPVDAGIELRYYAHEFVRFCYHECDRPKWLAESIAI